MEPREELGILDDYISSSYVQCSEYASKPNRQSPHPQNNPLGLVFWQGRVKMRSSLTLPKSAAHGNPIGLVSQIQLHIGMRM